MRQRYLALLLAVIVSVAAAAQSPDPLAPRIVALRDGQAFHVHFEKGAVFACTVYKMVKATEEPSETWPDGRYAPRHCWNLSAGTTFYTDDWEHIKTYSEDWDVWAEIGYPFPSKTVPGVTDVVYTSTNIVRVRH